MSFVATKSKFHVALNGIGMILQGSPERPGYQQNQAPTYGQRFASGDRSYNDLSKWWYFAQTDWSGGFTDVLSWVDNASHYLSRNIDSWSEPGAFKLARAQELQNTFTEDTYCGIEAVVNGSTNKYIGTTENSGTSKPIVYKLSSGTWSDISSSYMGTNQNVISQLKDRLGYLWACTVGVGTTTVVGYYSGSAWTDCSANINSVLSFSMASSRCQVTIGSKHYVFGDDNNGGHWALVSCTKANPSAGADWTKVIEQTTDSALPIAACEFQGSLYYLLNRSNQAELRVYNPSTGADTSVRVFKNTGFTNWAGGDKLLVNLNGILIITIVSQSSSSGEVWSYDGSTLKRIYKHDANKDSLSGTELLSNNYAYLVYGATISDNKAWWGNLMYDGDAFFYWISDSADGSNFAYPLFTDTSDQIWLTQTGNQNKAYSYSHTGSVYKGSTGKNYMLFTNFDTVSGIDKLLYSITVLFKPLVSGQKIIVKYYTGELTASSTFTQLGTIDYSIDGGSTRDKKFFLPAGTTFKKLWIKIELEGNGTNTPGVTDVLSEYLPIPSPSKQWALNINCGDEVTKLDGRLVEKAGRELRALIENAWWTKSTLDFQDLDYASTTLNMGGTLSASATTITVTDTTDFPEQGRFRIDDEEIFYTGKTPTTLTGLTRGARDTKAATHSDTTQVHNGYKVLVTDLQTRVPAANEDKNLEYIVGISLREA